MQQVSTASVARFTFPERTGPWFSTVIRNRRDLFLLLPVITLGMMPPVGAGLVFEGPVYSEILKTNRIIHVYLPDSYDTNPERRYPVLYVLDGQNAFSSAGTNAAFGWGAWNIDLIAAEYARAGKMQEIIIVGIDAPPDRYAEYRGPVYRYDLVRNSERDPFERFNRFLIEELKPRIDRRYRTSRAPEATGLMGSSLGGIASLAVTWAHPEIFGLAASLSGSFQIEQKRFIQLLRDYQGKPKPLRIYLDSGGADFSGGDDGREVSRAVVEELRRIGWRDAINLRYYVDEILLTEAALKDLPLRSDKIKEAQRSQHNEFYWRQRVWRPLVFLFPAAPPK